MHTLVVVDMQEEFEAANNEGTIFAVQEAIKRAIKMMAPIVMLEYFNSAPSFDRLRGLVENYTQGFIVEKKEDNGGEEVLHTCKEHNLPKNFEICGVNLSFCVMETAEHLVREYPTSLIVGACNNIYPEWIKMDIERMRNNGISIR